MCTTLCNIRQKFKAEDPVQHAFESMEHVRIFFNTFSVTQYSATLIGKT